MLKFSHRAFSNEIYIWLRHKAFILDLLDFENNN